MLRLFGFLMLAAASLWAATVRLYLKDGSYHLVREYSVQGDRVRYYSTERGEWEEIPLTLVDLNRTVAESKAEVDRQRKEAAEMSAEEAAERAEREERERVPLESGVYLLEGKELRSLKQAESKVVTNKSRSVLKVLAPVPVITGKSTVELDGGRSVTVIEAKRPEFYVRLAADERFGIVKLTPKKAARVVQKWTVIPVSNELVEEQLDVEVFRKQIADGLYKIWPMKPLDPGEYAVVEYTQGKGNIQVWDFSVK